ncbi:GNAT family N-acetyltransferase [Hyphomicrobium sp. LHD-15]|uniref:GNAT family N-acetyltransferase n=1 Tax=Hyphomicrobium sp. LHD-15 TaxID=3072142 RepID=UPI00280CB21E|nr:GNAT family N-acetyltransferase [Hyphomicrobium sp. LHD-15]MDQ8700862.1 GNAT family N-acetyltransferase [Hyphomicrobium sp. LHD-15]
MIDARTYQAATTLSDGTSVTVRAIRPDDWRAVLTAFEGLDSESVYKRFFTYKKTLADDELRQITEVDFDRVVALVVVTAENGGDPQLIGGGRYAFNEVASVQDSAEIAFITSEGYRGRGVAPLLLKHLAGIARERGVSRFEAQVLSQNQAMLSVFRRSGLPITTQFNGDVFTVCLSLIAG